MSNENPLISVVIPTYNHAHFLTRALQSVLDQTYPNWEAIVIDNHSKDNTDEVVSSFVDPRIRLLKIHNNGIIAASRNKGIAAANGEWVAFLDSDDWWTSQKLQRCLQQMGETTDLVYHDLKVEGGKKSFLRKVDARTRQVKNPVLPDLLVNGNLISNSSVVVRRKLLAEVGNLDESAEMIGAEDFNGWLKIASITNHFIYIPEFLGFYEFHENGISRKDMSECYRKAVAEFTRNIDQTKRMQVEAHIFYMKGRYHFLHNKFDQAIQSLKHSLQNGTVSIRIKSLVVLLRCYLHV